MVTVVKANGDVRICIHPKDLNKSGTLPQENNRGGSSEYTKCQSV